MILPCQLSWSVPAQWGCGTATPGGTGQSPLTLWPGQEGSQGSCSPGRCPRLTPARHPRCWGGDFGEQSRFSSLHPWAVASSSSSPECRVAAVAPTGLCWLLLPPSCQSSDCNLFLHRSGSSRDQGLYSCPVPWTSDPPQWDTPFLCHQCHLQLPAEKEHNEPPSQPLLCRGCVKIRIFMRKHLFIQVALSTER